MNEKKADRKAMIRLVTDQIQKKDPPFVAEAFEMLKEKGIGKAQAKEKIVDSCDALEGMLNGMNDLIAYQIQIADMLEAEGIEESSANNLDAADTRFPYMSLSRVYRALEDGEGAAGLLLEWPVLKEYIQTHYERVQPDGCIAKPVYSPVSFNDHGMETICEALEDAGMECLNSNEPEKMASLMQDVVNTFEFKDESCYLYDTLEVFTKAGMYRERDEWYAVWHQRFPDCQNIVNSYGCALLNQKPLDFAKTDVFLDEIAAHPDGWDEDWEYMLDEAADMYHERGMSDKEAVFRRLSKKKSRFRR